MEKDERKKLVVELYKNLKFAKIQADMQSSAEKNEKKELFIRPKGIRINSKYLSNKEYFQIAQFYEFLKENPNLADDEIRVILNSNNKFSFLRKLDRCVPDLFGELRLHGPMCIATDYASRKKTDKELNRVLP